jgi:hypothetical protein
LVSLDAEAVPAGVEAFAFSLDADEHKPVPAPAPKSVVVPASGKRPALKITLVRPGQRSPLE